MYFNQFIMISNPVEENLHLKPFIADMFNDLLKFISSSKRHENNVPEDVADIIDDDHKQITIKI